MSKCKLTHKILRARLFLDEKRGVFFWKERPLKDFKEGGHSQIHNRNAWNAKFAGKQAGCFCEKTKYVLIRLCGKVYLAHRLVWFYVHGSWPLDQLDHINMKRSDNRIVNLREASNSQNTMNRGVQSNSTTKIKGVSFDKARNKFAAEITVNGIRHRLGRFDTKEEAAKVYKRAAKKLHGDFARFE